MITRIRAKYIIAYRDGSHALLRDGEVVFQDDTVIYTGKEYQGKVDVEIDAGNKIISPGLINMHTLASTSVTYLTLDGPHSALDINKEYILKGDGELDLTEDEIRLSSKFALTAAIKGGATTVVPITPMAYSLWESPIEQAEYLAKTAGELGVRAYVSHQYRSMVKYKNKAGQTDYYIDENEGLTGLSHAMDFCEKFEDTYGGRIRTTLFPYQFETCKPKLLEETRKLADSHKLPIKMHAAEFTNQFHESLRRYGKTPTHALHDLGILGEKTILTHMLHTTCNVQSGFPRNDTSDIQRLADTGTTVVRCPALYSRGFAGPAGTQSFSRFSVHGVNMTLGTDTYPMDMLREMRLAAILGKAAEGDKINPTAADVFNAATLNAAKALGRDDIGRIEAGSKADLIIIDLNKIELAMIDDPLKTIVYMAGQGDIDTVIIDGKTLVQDGCFQAFDETSLFEPILAINQRQKNTFVKYNPSGKPAEELFPPSFPDF